MQDYLTVQPDLHRAVEQSDLDALQNLLETAVGSRAEDFASIIDAVYYGDTALGFAVSQGNLPAVSLLLEYGANPDIYEEMPPLMIAVMSAKEEIVAVLLEWGADANNYESEFQQTALMRAVDQHLTDTVTNLLMYRANPKKKDRFGDSTLDRAESKGDEIVLSNLRNAASQFPDVPDDADDYYYEIGPYIPRKPLRHHLYNEEIKLGRLRDNPGATS